MRMHHCPFVISMTIHISNELLVMDPIIINGHTLHSCLALISIHVRSFMSERHSCGMNDNARHALDIHANDMYIHVRSFMSEKHSINEHAHSGVTIQP